jgi:hypothetical protein
MAGPRLDSPEKDTVGRRQKVICFSRRTAAGSYVDGGAADMESLLSEIAFAMFIAAHALAILLLQPHRCDEAARHRPMDDDTAARVVRYRAMPGAGLQVPSRSSASG